jgi:hypothetical protein
MSKVSSWTTDGANSAKSFALKMCQNWVYCHAHLTSLIYGLGNEIVVGKQDGQNTLGCVQNMYDLSYWMRHNIDIVRNILMDAYECTFDELPANLKTMFTQVCLSRWTNPYKVAAQILDKLNEEANDRLIQRHHDLSGDTIQYIKENYQNPNGKVSFLAILFLVLANEKNIGFANKSKCFVYCACEVLRPYFWLQLSFLKDQGKLHIKELDFFDGGPTAEQLNDGINEDGDNCFNLRAIISHIFNQYKIYLNIEDVGIKSYKNTYSLLNNKVLFLIYIDCFIF